MKTIRRELAKRGIRHRVEENGALVRVPLAGVNYENILCGARPETRLVNGRWTYPAHLAAIERLLPARKDYFFHVGEADYSHDVLTIEEAVAQAARLKKAARQHPHFNASKEILGTPVKTLARQAMAAGEKRKVFTPASIVVRIAHWKKLAAKLKKYNRPH
ncbi:MAG: hypothetical protein AB1626_02115 [Candidatus Micrarchaeota archaeon]